MQEEKSEKNSYYLIKTRGFEIHRLLKTPEVWSFSLDRMDYIKLRGITEIENP